MKKNYLLLLVLILFISTMYGQKVFDPETDTTYRLVWEDNFNNFNPTRWKKAHNFDHYGEAEVYLDSNVNVSNGYLQLILKHQRYHADSSLLDSNHCFHQKKYGIDYEYTSGWIESKMNYSVSVNSYVEAEIKFPYGKSYFPAFWLFKSDDAPLETDYNEIDIVEILGWKGQDTTTSNTHPLAKGKIILLDSIGINYNYNDSFLVFGVKWLPDSVLFYINGRLSYALVNSGQMVSQRIVFNFAMEKNYTTGIVLNPADSLRCPDTMFVNYVRVYKHSNDSTYTTNKQKSPYLVNPLKYKFFNGNMGRQMQIMWQLDQTTFDQSNGYCLLELGTDSNNLQSYINNIPQITSDHLYSVLLRAPTGYTFYYRVNVIEANTQLLANQPFPELGSFILTPDENSMNAKFYAYGDTRGGSEGANPPFLEDVSRAILKEIDADPDSQTLLLHAGDWNQSDTEKSWNGEFFNNSNKKTNELHSKVAIMGVKGNHEEYYEKTGKNSKKLHLGENFKKYFPFPYRNDSIVGNDFSYDFDYGPVHFVMIYVNNHNYNLSPEEEYFLDSSLAYTDKKWKIIVFHAPVKSIREGLAGITTQNIIRQKAQQYGVQAVIMGHEHYYSHWVENGTHYMILGGGGSGIEPVIKDTIISSNEIYAATAPHFAKFDIQNDIMMIDIIQGANYLADTVGTRIEKFTIPVSTQINTAVNFNNPVDHPIITDVLNIKQGGTATISSSVNFTPKGTIIVEKGGELIVQGQNAIITSTHRNPRYILFKNNPVQIYSEPDSMWNGIIVEGDPSLNQFSFANQGVLRVLSGATIQNAICAVHVISPPPSLTTPSNPQGGGIIRIDNANFVNNQYGIIMEHYSNFNAGGFVYPQFGYIRNTSFVTDSMLIDTSYTPEVFIKLHGIYKMNIIGCRFENTYDNNFANHNHGTGIYSYNSSFNIIPGLQGDSTVFINLERGINAIANQSDIPLNVMGTAFNDVHNALYISGVSNAKVTKCKFDMVDNAGYGLYLDNCTHYTVEQNAFYAPNNATTATAAMVINNSGSDANEVYNNYFQNFPAAMLAQHDNWGGSFLYGLQIKCNDFNNCMQDIAITENYNYTGKTGISAYQGSKANNKSLAGNTFSHKGYSTYFGNNPYSDYNNEKGIVISKYYHHNGTVGDLWVPKYYTYGDPTTGSPMAQTQIVPDNVIGQSYIKAQSCPDRQSNNSGSSIIVLYDSINAQQVQLNSAKLTLSIYEDGGNPELNEEIATAYPWETWQYYNELMLASPYLSDETLIEAINNTDLLPTNLLKLILLANPQCSRSEEVMDMLYARIPAMSQTDIDQILQKQGDSSPIDELKANVNYYTHERMRYATQIENSYLKDTINDYAMDSLINFLGRENNVNAKYRLAFLYYHKGEYDLMNNTLSDIDVNFELTERQTEEKADFISYFSIMQSMAENDLIFDELSVEQKQSIQSLSSGIYLPGAYARSMLLQYDNTFSYTEPVIFPVITSSRKAKPTTTDNNINSIVKIYPNPAIDYISIENNLTGEIMIKIVDNTGRIVFEKMINSKMEIIGLDNLSPGSYQILFFNNNQLIETKKLTIIK